MADRAAVLDAPATFERTMACVMHLMGMAVFSLLHMQRVDYAATAHQQALGCACQLELNCDLTCLPD